VQAIVRRLDEMTRKGEYETRDYLAASGWPTSRRATMRKSTRAA